MRPVLACLALLAAAPVLGGCRFARSQPGVHLSSTPPGARIVVDGTFTGFVTPAGVDLSTDEWHVVELTKPGYASQTRLVGPGGRVLAIDWRQSMVGAIDTFRFPLFLPFEDVVPVVVESRNVPQRVHVHLRRAER